MSHEVDLWSFVKNRLGLGQAVMLLIVAASTGSSPGRAGYKMMVADDGELFGSIGGGVMEVELAEAAKLRTENGESRTKAEITEQVHRRDVENASGMICSGRQTVIVNQLNADDLPTVDKIIGHLESNLPAAFEISNLGFRIIENTLDDSNIYFAKTSQTEFVYQEMLGHKNELFIIGGGHCALALSEVASRLDFRISIFDDRPELNTIGKNAFADSVTIVDSYDQIASHIPSGDDVYVVVMTLGYLSDAVVIRQLIDHELKYFGVLGSKAKMATLIKELRDEGIDAEKLTRIHTPIGLPINSRTPEEIAVSIVAEIISIKNS